MDEYFIDGLLYVCDIYVKSKYDIYLIRVKLNVFIVFYEYKNKMCVGICCISWNYV